MKKKVLVVGGVAGGASFAARVRRLDEHAEVIMFERGPNVSFSNCALPFHLSGIVEDADDLVLMTPEVFLKQYNIIARVNQEVVSIDRKNKTVEIINHLTKESYQESYDVLMLSPGASPVMPKSIEGIEKPHVFSIRNVVDIKKVQGYIEKKNVSKVTVVGGGFIGIEAVENLKLAGKDVTLVEAADQVMIPFDYDMAQVLHKELMDQGVNCILSDSVVSIDDTKVTLKSGTVIESEVVIMAIGVRPETELAIKAELELGKTGGIKVNHNYQTNDPSIYAVGDAIEVSHLITHDVTRLTLAGPAQRQARAAADHVYGKTYINKGVIGSSVVQCFEMNAACTGLNEKTCIAKDIDYRVSYVIPGDKVGLMPNVHPMHFKLIFQYPTGQILGAQAIGLGNVDKRIDVIAAMISMHANLTDLAELELSYSPMFGTAKDVVNHAALVGLNLLNHEFEQVRVSEVRELVENNAFIIDAREVDEFAAGHLINATNIPLSEFRSRLNEIPKDQPVYIHCRSAQRSYNMVRALQQHGFDNVKNISGSYLGICTYEYFNDQVLNRKKIVTEYNFN